MTALLQAFGKSSWFKGKEPRITEEAKAALGRLGVKVTSEDPLLQPDRGGGWELGTWRTIREYSLLLEGVPCSAKSKRVGDFTVFQYKRKGLREKVLANFSRLKKEDEKGKPVYRLGPDNGVTFHSGWVEEVLLPLFTDESDPPVHYFS